MTVISYPDNDTYHDIADFLSVQRTSKYINVFSFQQKNKNVACSKDQDQKNKYKPGMRAYFDKVVKENGGKVVSVSCP